MFTAEVVGDRIIVGNREIFYSGAEILANPLLESGTKEWLDARRDHIGASEVAPILGFSKYSTIVDVWKSKISLKENSDSPSSMFGRLLEPTLRVLAKSNFGEDAITASIKYEFTDPVCPIIRASPDGILISGDDAYGIECKTAGISSREDWESLRSYCEGDSGELFASGSPFCYYVQATVQMMCMPFVKGIVFSVYMDNKHFSFTFKRESIDNDLVDNIRKSATSFWNFVTTKTTPPATRISEIERVDEGVSINDDESFREKFQEISMLTKEISAADARKKELTLEIAKACSTRKTIFKGGSGVWIDSTGLDTSSLKRDYPELVEKYSTSKTKYFRVYPKR